MNNYIKQKNTGFTLIEIIVAVGVFALMIGLVGAYQSDVFSLNRVIQQGLNNQSEAKKIIRPFINEVRSASPSSLGTYPIKTATPNEFIFYSDLDSDGLKEEVRYYLDEGVFKKGVIAPSGNPLVYDEQDEDVIQIVHDVINTGIFQYFDSTYTGNEEMGELTGTISPSDVRLVKIELTIDSNPDMPPAATTVSTQVSIRNLKDNL